VVRQANLLVLRGWIRSSWLAIPPETPSPINLGKWALTDLNQAIGIHPDYSAFLTRGKLYEILARRADLGSIRSVEFLTRALQDYDQSLEMHSPNPDAQILRIEVLHLLTEHSPDSNRQQLLKLLIDSIPTLDRWIGDTESAHHASTLFLRAKILAKKGNDHQEKGVDAAPIYQASVRDFTHYLKIGKATELAYLGRSSVLFQWGKHAISRNRDPFKLFQQSEEDLLKLVSMGDQNTTYWDQLGRVQQCLAVSTSQNPERASQHLSRASRSLNRALRIDPQLPQTHLFLGFVSFQTGLLEQNQRQDPGPHFRAALDSWNQAIKQDPTLSSQVGKQQQYCRKYLQGGH
jgi:tetratricopeptide (TPR) repeat protein